MAGKARRRVNDKWQKRAPENRRPVIGVTAYFAPLGLTHLFRRHAMHQTAIAA